MSRLARYTDPKELIKLQDVYEGGEVPMRQICKDWELSTRTLQKYIKKYGWSRVGEDQKSTSLYAKKRLQYNIELSEQNKKKLIESGGNELYHATITYFENAAEIQLGTKSNLLENKRVFEELKEKELELDGNSEELTAFYQLQTAKTAYLLDNQRLIQMASKSAAETINGLRVSLGLNNNEKDKTGDINVNILIADGLRKGRERIVQIKNAGHKDVSNVVMPVEQIEK